MKREAQCQHTNHEGATVGHIRYECRGGCLARVHQDLHHPHTGTHTHTHTPPTGLSPTAFCVLCFNKDKHLDRTNQYEIIIAQTQMFFERLPLATGDVSKHIYWLWKAVPACETVRVFTRSHKSADARKSTGEWLARAHHPPRLLVGGGDREMNTNTITVHACT